MSPVERPTVTTALVPVRGEGAEREPFPLVDLDDVPAPYPTEEDP